MGCKRPGFHNTYLETFNRDNVRLVTEPIEKITGSGVATTDGETHEVDVLILATGFKVLDPDEMLTYRVSRPGGQSLAQFWDNRRLQPTRESASRASRTSSWCSGPTATSARRTSRSSSRRATTSCAASSTRTRPRAGDPGGDDRYFAEMMRKQHRQIFWQDSCLLANSYYFDKNGDVPLRPATTLEAYWRSRRYPMSDYRFSA